MKKYNVERYDLDKVYYMNQYTKTVAYGKTNAHISGVEELLQNLETGKNQYFKDVSEIVNAERKNEETKYQRYDKWRKLGKYCILIWILILFFLIISQYFPIEIRNSFLFNLFELLFEIFLFWVVPFIFIIATIMKHIYRISYNRYKESVHNRIIGVANDFTQNSKDCYEAIDNLYLLWLEPAHRELVLMRREQDAHNQEMLRLEKERQRVETERYNEQRKAREATEKLLEIEREREKRRNSW